jgi:hypothetical protein
VEIVKAAVYVLCLLASAVCAGLLVRTYVQTGAKLLLWSASCFVLLATTNLLVVIDLLVLPPTIDLLPLRRLTTLGGIGVLLYGFIWESD